MEPILDPEFQELEQELLRAGREVKMSPALQAKTLAALGVGAVGVGAAVTAKSSVLGWLSSKAGLVGGTTLLGGAAVAGALALAASGGPGETSPPTDIVVAPQSIVRGPEGETATATAPPPVPPQQALAEPNVITSPEDSAPVGDEMEIETPSKAMAVRPGENPKFESAKSAAQTRTASSGGLAAELTHLKGVEEALRKGDPSLALSRLGSYRKAFPQRQLGLEAEVLTIQALYDSGARATAKERAARFVQKHPQSPLGARAKQYLK